MVIDDAGHKFENLATLPRPWAECTRTEIDSRDDEIVNNNVQYCSVARTSIGSTSLLLGGEVDCVMGEKPSNPDAPIPWIELKTTAEPWKATPWERQKFEKKLLKFWAQSFLLGVPTIMVGFRSMDGYLRRIQEYETQKVPGIVSRGEGAWNGNVCINFTSTFLDFLKETLTGQDGVWRIKRALNEPEICVFRVEDTGTGNILRETFKKHRERIMAIDIAKKLGSS